MNRRRQYHQGANSAPAGPAGRRLYCCRLTETLDATGILWELLAAQDWPFSTWTEVEKNVTCHTVYSETEEGGDEIHRKLMARLPAWEELGVRVIKIEKTTLAYEDWAETWKKFYPILRIPPRIVVKPSWLDYAPQAGDVILEMDPGMSFGTGQHATTRAGLTMLQTLADRKRFGPCLDAGCGSGILSVAAVKLGFHPVTVLDCDPVAVRIAAANLAGNRLTPEQYELHCADLAEFASSGHRYQVICANILAPVLVRNAPGLLALLEPGGALILSGILSREYPELRTVFVELGFREEDVRLDEEWQSGLFAAPL